MPTPPIAACRSESDYRSRRKVNFRSLLGPDTGRSQAPAIRDIAPRTAIQFCHQFSVAPTVGLDVVELIPLRKFNCHASRTDQEDEFARVELHDVVPGLIAIVPHRRDERVDVVYSEADVV
jgi:hypothetical protein